MSLWHCASHLPRGLVKADKCGRGHVTSIKGEENLVIDQHQFSFSNLFLFILNFER